MFDSINQLLPLLFVSGIVAIFARRWKLPYTVGLVLVGLVLSLSGWRTGTEFMSKDILFFLLLPPLIFEAAFHIDLKELRANAGPIILMATLGVLVSAVLITCIGHYLLHWSLSASALFGIIISATDPVSVIATFKETSLTGRIRLLVESESLLNDGTVGVIFFLAVAYFTTGSISPLNGLGSFAISVFGGIGIGCAVAALTMLIAGPTEDHLVEITFTAIACFGSFLLAEKVHSSGILAVTAAGLILGNYGHLGSITDKGREAAVSFWEFAAFLADSVIFLELGIGTASQHLSPYILISFGAFLTMVFGRALAVYLSATFFRRSRSPLTWNEQHVLVWGGLRGALALILAQSLPDRPADMAVIKSVILLVVTMSVLIQGITISPLLRKLGVLPRQV